MKIYCLKNGQQYNNSEQHFISIGTDPRPYFHREAGSVRGQDFKGRKVNPDLKDFTY